MENIETLQPLSDAELVSVEGGSITVTVGMLIKAAKNVLTLFA
jgi:hypothetical protein